MKHKTDFKPDVLRVVEYVLKRAEEDQSYSVCTAARAPELNGINEYRIAEIFRDICLEPEGPNSMEKLTTVDGNYSHSQQGRWQLNANAYFSYLSYLSIQQSEQANKIATRAFYATIGALVATILSIFLG